MIRMDYGSFDDYWAPIAAGEGPLGKYVAALNAAERARTDAAVRDAYEAGRPTARGPLPTSPGPAEASFPKPHATFFPGFLSRSSSRDQAGPQ